ncbi:MAG: S9 family peptidase [Anaerolineales bacterium]|nr:S9 family peptidase [Anaerolineales bacterium]
MPIPVERFFSIRVAYGPTFGPDGARLAFVATISGVPQAYVLPAGGGWPDPITFGADRVVTVNWSPAGDVLAFARDTGGNECTQLYLVNADGSGERQITGDLAAMHLFGAWSPDGQTIYFTANRRDRRYYDAYALDLTTGAERLLWQNDQSGYLLATQVAPGSHPPRLLLSLARSSTDNDLYELEVTAEPRTRHLTPHAGEARYLSPVYAADGRGVFVATDQGRDLAAVARIDATTLEQAGVAEPPAEVEELAASADGRWLAWAENVEGRHALRALDLHTRKVHTAPLPRGVVVAPPADLVLAGMTFSPAGPVAAFGFSTPTRTPDVWTWDLAANTVRQVTHSSHAGIPAAALTEPELIRYPTFDGRRIPAWFYRAGAPDRRRPVVVFVHGGPEGQTQALLIPVIQYLTHRGYHVLAPNVRGSSGYGKTYLNLDNVEKRLDAVADLAHAAQWLRAQPEVDGHRLAVYGGSYGGFMVLAAITRYPDLWAAAVDIVGIANFVTFLENTGAYRRAIREAEYGSLARDRDLLTEISPIHRADEIRAPLFVIHGRNDPRVPLAEAEQIVAALRRWGVPVELAVYDDEGHGLVKLKNKLDAFPRVAAFLDAHLMDD